MPSAEHIDFVDSMVETVTIEYMSEHPNATYDDYVRLLDWYWRLPAVYKRGWVFDWIRALTD